MSAGHSQVPAAAHRRARIWPEPVERRRLFRMWWRCRRQPDRDRRLPPAWRRQIRLAFWWTLLAASLDEPGLMLAALAAPGAWLALLLWRWHGG